MKLISHSRRALLARVLQQSRRRSSAAQWRSSLGRRSLRLSSLSLHRLFHSLCLARAEAEGDNVIVRLAAENAPCASVSSLVCSQDRNAEPPAAPPSLFSRAPSALRPRCAVGRSVAARTCRTMPSLPRSSSSKRRSATWDSRRCRSDSIAPLMGSGGGGARDGRAESGRGGGGGGKETRATCGAAQRPAAATRRLFAGSLPLPKRVPLK